jgi:hypothetical protein
MSTFDELERDTRDQEIIRLLGEIVGMQGQLFGMCKQISDGLQGLRDIRAELSSNYVAFDGRIKEILEIVSNK